MDFFTVLLHCHADGGLEMVDLYCAMLHQFMVLIEQQTQPAQIDSSHILRDHMGMGQVT